MLVVTPEPNKDESLFGYILRVSEANGYGSPAPVLSIAGYSTLMLRSANFDCRKLSKVLGVDGLESISYSSLSSLAIHSAAGGFAKKRLRVPDLWRLDSPKICPHCIHEKGFIEQHWDLAFMTACPKHRIKALSECPSCGVSLGWARPGLLKCKCGAKLDEVTIKPVSDDIVRTTGFLLRLFYDDPARQDLAILERLGLDWADLSYYDLVCLMNLLHREMPRGKPRKNRYDSGVDLLGTIVKRWPNSYHEYLSSVKKHVGLTHGEPDTLVRHYKTYFEYLKSCKAGHEVSKLLMSEFIKFGFETYGQAFVDSRLATRIALTYEPKFMSLAQASSKTGISPATLKRWAEKGVIDSVKVKAGTNQRLILNTINDVLLKNDANNILNTRKASAYTGIPVSVLGYLDREGIFKHENKSSIRPGFHVKDLDSLLDKLIIVAPVISNQIDTESVFYSLSYILKNKKFRQSGQKNEFVAEYLAGNISAAYRDGESLDKVYFECRKVDEFINIDLDFIGTPKLNLRQASEVIAFPYDVVRALYSEGYLSGSLGSSGQVFLDRNSVFQFFNKFVSLNSLSKTSGFGVRRLINYCRVHLNDLTLYSVKRRNDANCFFVSREDSEELLRSMEEHFRNEVEFCRSSDKKPSKEKLLEFYFDGLVASELALPRRAGVPNLAAISKAVPDLSRNDFYKCDGLRALLDKFDESDRQRFALDKRDDMQALELYLNEVSQSGAKIPTNQWGKPNKSKIAKECGIDRKFLYDNKFAVELIQKAAVRA